MNGNGKKTLVVTYADAKADAEDQFLKSIAAELVYTTNVRNWQATYEICKTAAEDACASWKTFSVKMISDSPTSLAVYMAFKYEAGRWKFEENLQKANPALVPTNDYQALGNVPTAANYSGSPSAMASANSVSGSNTYAGTINNGWAGTTASAGSTYGVSTQPTHSGAFGGLGAGAATTSSSSIGAGFAPLASSPCVGGSASAAPTPSTANTGLGAFAPQPAALSGSVIPFGMYKDASGQPQKRRR